MNTNAQKMAHLLRSYAIASGAMVRHGPGLKISFVPIMKSLRRKISTMKVKREHKEDHSVYFNEYQMKKKSADKYAVDSMHF